MGEHLGMKTGRALEKMAGLPPTKARTLKAAIAGARRTPRAAARRK